MCICICLIKHTHFWISPILIHCSLTDSCVCLDVQAPATIHTFHCSTRDFSCLWTTSWVQTNTLSMFPDMIWTSIVCSCSRDRFPNITDFQFLFVHALFTIICHFYACDMWFDMKQLSTISTWVHDLYQIYCTYARFIKHLIMDPKMQSSSLSSALPY